MPARDGQHASLRGVFVRFVQMIHQVHVLVGVATRE